MSNKHETDYDIDMIAMLYSMVHAIQNAFDIRSSEAKELICDAILDKNNNTLEIVEQYYHIKHQ